MMDYELMKKYERSQVEDKVELLATSLPMDSAKDVLEQTSFMLTHTMREMFIERYGFAIPTKEVIDELSKQPIVEVGCGTGLFTKLVNANGGDCIATSLESPKDSKYTFNKELVSIEILSAVEAVKKYPERDVFMSWPCYGMPWAYETAKQMQSGRKLYYIGESWGGCTADDKFFEYIDDNFNEVVVNAQIVSFDGLHDYFEVYMKK